MPERLIAIGDIHGCADALEGLLRLIQPGAGDRLILLGDYVDRGPDSRGVIERILQLQRAADVIAIMGNHEEMMLSVMDRKSPLSWWFMYGGRETMESYGADQDFSAIPDEHLAFLRELRPYHEEREHFFVHANYVASEPLDEQPPEALRWLSLKDRLPPRHRSGKRAIVGHTSQKSGEVLDRGHLVCLDTFCFGGKWLTAMDVNDGHLWQVDPAGKPREEP